MKRNGAILGFLMGAVLPLIGFIVMYFLWGKAMSLAEFINHLKFSHDTLSKVMALSLLINLIPFVIISSKRTPSRDLILRGIFSITMIYVAVALMVKFVW